ncbi:hypothetical protein AB205_0160430, partial [Aquarana catesbeiana]
FGFIFFLVGPGNALDDSNTIHVKERHLSFFNKMETSTIKVEQDDEMHGEVSHVQIKTEANEIKEGKIKAGESGDEQEDKEQHCPDTSQTLSTENEEDYGILFSQYTTTLYDAAMEAVTQSILTNKNISNRKKSPAWNHFFISPRDSTKAICMYCMKEFSRGKNEKDLSTSCLMRHVRRAHPRVLASENGNSSGISYSPPTLVLPLQPPDVVDTSIAPTKMRKLATKVSPEKVVDEPSSVISSDEISSDVSISEKNVKEEVSASPSAVPNSQSDESAENITEKPISNPKNSSGSRRRSAVWKHFYLSPLDNSKAVCIHCMNEFSRGKNGKDLGTSCLIRHMWRAHRSIVLQENSGGTSLPPPYSVPPTLLPSILPADGEVVSAAASPGKMGKDPVSVPPSPDRVSEDLQYCSSNGDLIIDDGTPVLHSSENVGEALCSPGKTKQCHGSSGYDAPVQQNKKVIKRLKSEVWLHFTLSPNDNLKAVCRYCNCMISRGKNGDFGTSCLMRHLYRRHPEIVLNQKSFDVSLANSPYATLASAECSSSKMIDLSTVAVHDNQVVFPSNSKKTSKLWNHFSICSADSTKVICMHCGRTISRGKKPTNLGTSCLLRHLQRFHSNVLQTNDMYENVKHIIVSHLKEAESGVIHFTAGIWMSSQTREYLTLTAHWVTFDSSFKPHNEDYHCSALLHVSQIDCDYNGVSVQKHLEYLWEAWITSFGLQIGITVTDNHSIGKTLNENDRSSVECFGHTVDLIVNEAIKTASKEMSMHTATLSQVIPMIHILNRKIEMLFEETMGIDTMLKSLKEAMVCRLSSTLHDPRYVFATLLDPRYKASLFSEEEAEEYKLGLIRELEILNSTSDDAPVLNGCNKHSPNHKEDNIWSLMANIKKSKNFKEKLPEDIVLAYLEEEVLEHNCDPLTYWNLKKSSWPVLSKLAVRFLGCPPSIVPSEKLFNTSNDSGSFNQTRLMMEHFEQLIFLKVNLPLIYFQY